MGTEDDLNTIEYLIMETLISRVRLGEYAWTFPKGRRSLTRALGSLEDKGLARFKTDTYGNFMVFITAAGTDMFADPKYQPPGKK